MAGSGSSFIQLHVPSGPLTQKHISAESRVMGQQQEPAVVMWSREHAEDCALHRGLPRCWPQLGGPVRLSLQAPVCRRGHSCCCSTCAPGDSPHRGCTGPGPSRGPWGWDIFPPARDAVQQVWGTQLGGTRGNCWVLAGQAPSHLWGRPCRRGCSRCGCSAVPWGTVSQPRTPAGTAQPRARAWLRRRALRVGEHGHGWLRAEAIMLIMCME